MAALSFGYAIPISGQYTPYFNKEDDSMVTKVQETCQLLSTKSNCQILVNNIPTHTDYNLSLTGTTQSIMEARGDLLSSCPLEIKLTLTIPPTTKLSLLNDNVDILQKDLKTKITIIPEKHNYSSLTSENNVSIEIIGIPTHVEQCRVRVLVLLDELLKNYTTDILQLPLKLQYLICGRKRAGLLPIIEETRTNIYFPSPFLNNNDDSPIYITGETSHVSRVKDMLNKLAVQKAKSMYHKEIALYARKIDWLLLHRRDDLRRIMHDNGAFIEFPQMGSGDDRVTVYAENRVNAERTLRALNFQACQIYEACFFFNNRDSAIYDTTGTASFFDSISNLSNLVSQLSQVSGSEVIYKTDPGCIEVLGSERAIRNVYQRLQEMQFLQAFHQYTIFRVESSNEQRDFISGKKNGKINKIMKTSGAKIKFIPYINDYNFIIEVESTSFTKALDGLTLLQEELPAEISFYVPESYHKRIIGVGGKNIQRIMKKYGVYVKFSNTEEFASLGGYYNNQDNVVARTPMKNQINLDNLRHAVMELIHPKDRDYMMGTIAIPFRLHCDLIHKYQDTFITDELVKKTNTQVFWPDAELASSTVELLGPEAHIGMAIKMLDSIIPEEYHLHFPKTEGLLSTEFDERVVQLLRQQFDMAITYHPGETDDYLSILMSREKVTTVFKDALTVMMDYFTTHNVALYENTTAQSLYAGIKQTQTSSQQPSTLVLDSTLLKPTPNQSAPLKRTEAPPPATATQSYPFFHFSNEFNNADWQKPKGSDSTIRAIFDAPLDLTDQERMVLNQYQRPTTNFGFPQGPDIWSTTPTNGNRRSGGFPSSSMSSPPSMRRGFYPMGEFNPYSSDNTASSSQSDPFSSQNNRMQNQGFQLGYYPPNNSNSQLQTMLDNLSINGNNTRRQNDHDDKGSRPPPGIDI